MKITDMEVIGLSFPLPPDRQWTPGKGIQVKTDCHVIKVYTDEGIVGIGEASPWVELEPLLATINGKLKHRFLGRNPFDVEKLTTPTDDRAQNVALAGLDMALWDIIGQATDTPIYKLLSPDGNYTETLRGYASAGVFYRWYERPEQLIDEALRWIDEGWTAFKMRMGTDWEYSGVTVGEFLDLMEQVAEAVDGQMELMVDANCRCRSVAEAVEIAKGLESLGFLWFEEPLPIQSEDSSPAELAAHYAAIRSYVRRMFITGGEGFTCPRQFAQFVAPGASDIAFDIVQQDTCNAGITGARKIAALAEEQGKLCCPHTWHNALTIASNAQLVAAIPNRFLLEYNANYNPLKSEILKEPLVPEKGYFHLSGKPGLGVELDEKAMKRFPHIEGPYSEINPIFAGR